MFLKWSQTWKIKTQTKNSWENTLSTAKDYNRRCIFHPHKSMWQWCTVSSCGAPSYYSNLCWFSIESTCQRCQKFTTVCFWYLCVVTGRHKYSSERVSVVSRYDGSRQLLAHVLSLNHTAQTKNIVPKTANRKLTCSTDQCTCCICSDDKGDSWKRKRPIPR